MSDMKRLAAIFIILFGTTAVAQEVEQKHEITARIVAMKEVLDEYASTVPERELVDDEIFAIAKVQWEKAGIMNTKYDYPEQLAEQVAFAEKVMKLLGKFKVLNVEHQGLMERAYIAENDMSSQPYIVYRPKSRPFTEALPLLIFLHGYASYLDKVNWVELMYSPDLEALAEKEGLMLLLPFGRSNTEFMGVGEADVLKTIELVKKRYQVDEDKVFLSGASMGGSGTWTIGCHYPHLFAGLSTIAGRYDYYLWKEIDPDKLSGFKRIQTDTDYAKELAANLRNISSFIFHGGADYLVNVEQSRGMFGLLQSLKCSTTYKEFDEGDHWIWSDCFGHQPYAEWLSKTRRNRYPKRVEYQTFSLKYNRGYWVRIDDFLEWGEKTSVCAEVVGENEIKVQTANVGRLTLLLDEAALERMGMSRQLQLEVNGRGQAVVIPPDGEVSVDIEALPRNGLRKTPKVCGPIREAYGGPFIIVFGSTGADVANEFNRAAAKRMASEWARFSAGRGLGIRDRDVTDELIQGKNLLLVGTPEDNSVLARIRDEIPVKFGDESYELGGRKYPMAGNGLLMIYPNPLNPERYILISSGVLWGSFLPINHKFDFLPDYIIFSDERDWDDNNNYLVAGYFDCNWQIAQKLMWFGKDESSALIVHEERE